MQHTKSFFIPTFLIFFLSLGLYDFPVTSYFVAWLGSFYVFYFTWFSKQRIINDDLPIASQIMRPIFLLQLIFAGFMCCTSIFLLLDHLGYEYFDKVKTENFVAVDYTYLIAKCQRLSFLAHISLVWGILIVSKTKSKRTCYDFNTKNLDFSWLKLGLLFYVVAVIFQLANGLFQFSIYFNNLAIFSSLILLLRGLNNKNGLLIAYGATIFGINFINATLTGFKEHIIVNFIILFALLFPKYKKTIAVIFIPVVYLLLYILPTYSGIIRNQSWSGDKTAQEARNEALETIIQDQNDEEIEQTNWNFLVYRFSEISMFTHFVEYVPKKKDFYHFEILENSIIALIPRILYQDKPITELVAMERVYDAGVVEQGANVSAKTRPVVDGYLSFGYIGVFSFLLALGYLTQLLCNTAERWFGGYEFGCIVMFNGCFQVLWRGNNFEFMLNNILYGFITMWLVFIVLRKMNILTPKR